nr:RebG-like n-glycosyl transferase [uncultured bacterium]
MLQVARELVRRGHEVRWYTGKVYREKIERIGAAYVPMCAGYDYSGANREEAFPHHTGFTGIKGMTKGFSDIFLATADGQMQDLLDALDAVPADILVTDETCFAAGFIRERTGIPQAWVATSIYIFSSRDTAPLGLGLRPNGSPLGKLRNKLLRWVADTVILRELRRQGDRARARAGLSPLDTGAFENIVEPPDLYLLGTVPAFEYPRSDLLPQVHFTGPYVGEPVEHFEPPAWWSELRVDRPVVHVTLGTVANDVERLLLPALRALAKEDVFVVATTGVRPERLDLAPLPANIRIEKFIPHHHLLPHVDVMVTNGGYGGVNMALAHGVPLVVAAATEEKYEVAAHVSWAGVGIHVKDGARLETRLRKAILRVLREPAYRQKAGALRDEYRRYDGPRKAAELIETLVDERPLK